MRQLTIIFLLTLTLIGIEGAYAQRYPERSKIRSANRAYEDGDYTGSEVLYLRALELDPTSVEARFNLANAQYNQERYEEAVNTLAPLINDSIPEDIRQKALYNQGNALFKQRKLEEALEVYKSSLRINPSDTSAKFNLAYTQKLLENEDGEGGGGGDDQNEDQDQNQDGDGDQDQNQDNQDQNEDQGDGDQDEDQGDGDQEQDQNGDQDPQDGQGNQPREQGISQQEAEQMLQAIQQSEDNTREKVNAEQAKGQASSIKNW